MALNRKEFELLSLIKKLDVGFSQRELSQKVGFSLGSVNRTLKALIEKRYLTKDGRKISLTEEGLSALEPYRVKRAVFLAAGFGSRLVPVTLNTPKPLIRVLGKPIIETMLDAVLRAGIREIVIVRGYLADHFDVLKEKYPMIQFVENPDYWETNNISSAMQVKHLFRNAYVLDSDLYLKNPDLIREYEYSSSYLGVFTEKTDDWRLIVKGGKVTGMKIGGTNCYHMYDITYWTEEDGKKMEQYLPLLFASPGGKKKYWDDVPLGKFNPKFNIAVRSCDEGDIVEIDTLSELKAIDPSYGS